MRWVRVHSHFRIWAANGPAPSFCITSDDDGEAFIEIAKRPELLIRPVSDSADSWNLFFSRDGSNDSSVAGAAIQLRRGRAEYTLPAAVWQNMSRVADLNSETDRRLYFRVWARPRGATSGGYISHSDTSVQQGSVPHLQILPLSGDLRTDAPVNDPQAVASLGLFYRAILGVIQLLGDDNPEKQALTRLLAHPVYRGQNSATIRGKILELFVKCGGAGRQIFHELLDLRVAVGSAASGGHMTAPALFHRDERNEGTTLDHLLALWNIKMDTRVSIPSISEVIMEVIMELTDPPGQLNQGYAGTCAATSIQCYTVVRNPAEYARWCRYIMDRNQNHRVQLAKNGSYMRANPEAFDVATWTRAWQRQNPGQPVPANWANIMGRTYSERAIQAAIMDYANTRHQYNPEEDAFYIWIFRVQAAGLFEFEITHAIEDIFNEPWKFDFGGGDIASAPNATAGTNLMSHLESGNLPVIITMKWGSGGHAVLGLRVENSRLIFRNPQYRGAYPATGVTTGANLTNPARRVHNASRAEESMDLAQLQAAIRGYVYESTNSSDRGYTQAEIPTHLQATVRPTAR